MDDYTFIRLLEREAEECELQAEHHAELAEQPEHREAGNAMVVAAQLLRRVARAAKEAA